MRSHHTPSPAALLAALALTACGAQAGPGEGPGGQTVTVTVSPGGVELQPGQTTRFAAAVTGTADLAVTWEVQETQGGSIDQAGLYTAPGSAGVYHVRAVSRADPTRSGTATITVNVPPAGAVAISPRTTTVAAGGTVTFTATVTNLPSSAVTWSVQETGCGTVTSAGVYTAPATGRTCHVIATSVSDSTRSDTATITVTAPVAVSISPATVTVDACRTQTFTATVTGTTDQVVTWSVTEGAAGGTVTSGGVYTAPQLAGTYHVVATSRASSAARATATVTVRDRVLSVAVDPASVSVDAGGSLQFRATINTTCGSFLATGIP
jgi:hypothetical protein